MGDIDIKGYDVYSDVKNDQVGNITDILVDETEKVRREELDIDSDCGSIQDRKI